MSPLETASLRHYSHHGYRGRGLSRARPDEEIDSAPTRVRGTRPVVFDAMNDSVEWITAEQRFAQVRAEWDELVKGEPTPFSDHAWFTCWWGAFRDDATLSVCVVWRGDRLVAAAPLYARGRRLFSMTNYHTPLLRFPASDGDALRAVVDATLDARPSDLSLHAIPADDVAISTLLERSAHHGRTSLVETVHTSPSVDTSGDRPSWEQTHSRELRELKRRRRKLEREHVAEWRLVEHSSNLDADLARGFAVEASGWKGRAGTAISSAKETDQFYRDVARAYHAQGELRLAWLHIDGRPVAFNFCVQRGRRLYLLKTGFDESVRQHAPGLLLNLYVIERCFEVGVEMYDFLGANAAWKQRFATGERAHVRLWSYRRRPVPLARYILRRGAVPLHRTWARRRAPLLED
jgi:CelD/BcsL family acetyltransferase involved in cellulose biosynthesis